MYWPANTQSPVLGFQIHNQTFRHHWQLTPLAVGSQTKLAPNQLSISALL